MQTLPNLYQGRYGESVNYLGDRHFLLTIAAAVALHLLGAFIWSLMPSQQVVEVPVRTLNLKLGSGGNIASSQASPRKQDNGSVPDFAPSPFNPRVAKPASKALAKASAPKLVTDLKPKPMVKAPDPRRTPVSQSPVPAAGQDAAIDAVRRAFHANAQKPAVRYVREQGGSGRGQGDGGSPYGNSLSGEEVQQRYTQLLSLWLDQRKVYPPEAQRLGLQGQVSVRIRIDRAGNVIQHYIAQSSGHPMLDEAVDRIVAGNRQVPRVPDRYPGGQQLEFLIPVIFSLR